METTLVVLPSLVCFWARLPSRADCISIYSVGLSSRERGRGTCVPVFMFNKAEDLCLRHIGPCTQEDDPCSNRGTDGKHLIDQGIPVCGSDGFTYVTPSALFCVKKNHNSCKYQG
uniref:Uncharacterized protein n=1 Tax=Timema shepardi TaxID=629360 RepID=A0A7R9B3G4_TIMSH|nr:unnamed protein product [Timema shepardi]